MGFTATGGVILDPAGQNFLPIGANIGTALGFDWNGTASGHALDAKAWGWNCVRLTFLATGNISWSWLATQGTLTQFINYLNTIVVEYTNQGIVVLLEAHDDPKTSGWVQSDVENQMATFWAAAATKWKDNAYVWYNPINEPRYINAEWVALHDMFCTTIRGAGATAPIVVDAPGWGQDAGYLAPYFTTSKYAYESDMAPVLNAEHDNIIVSCHNYGAKWDTITKITSWISNTRAAGLTPFFGEFGYTIDGTSTAGSYDANYNAAQLVFQVHRPLNVGISWWHGTHGDNYSLKLNGKAFWNGGPSVGLSEAGTTLWALGATVANQVRVFGVELDASTPTTPHKIRLMRAAIGASDPASPHKIRVTGMSMVVTPAAATRPQKVWDGSLWKLSPVKNYTGTAWV